MLPDLLHGDEKKVWDDAGYQGQTEAIRGAAPQAQDLTSRRVKTKAGVDETEKLKNRTKARVRAKVEWPFRILKRVFGFTKVRYRDLKKNHEWLCAGFALDNVYQHRKRLARIDPRPALQSFKGRSVSAGSQAWPQTDKVHSHTSRERRIESDSTKTRSGDPITRRCSEVP